MNDHNNAISNNKIAGKIIPAIISVIILVSFDQIAKNIVDNHLSLYDSIDVIPDILQIYYIRNSGAAWGILQNMQILFYIITSICLIFLLYTYIKLSINNCFKILRILIIFLFSGALGNFIDRIRFQYVIDFIYFKLINFPVFNIADCYVTVSVFIILFLFIFIYKEDDFNNIHEAIF